MRGGTVLIVTGQKTLVGRNNTVGETARGIFPFKSHSMDKVKKISQIKDLT